MKRKSCLWPCSAQLVFNTFVKDVCGFLKHVLDYWKKRNDPCMLFITYEDMKRHLPAFIERVAHFLDKDLSETDISELAVIFRLST